MVCSINSCSEDDSEHTLTCNSCKQLVHYKCTKLPTYQLQNHVNTEKSYYKCINCVDITKELADHMKDSIDLNQSKEVEE